MRTLPGCVARLFFEIIFLSASVAIDYLNRRTIVFREGRVTAETVQYIITNSTDKVKDWRSTPPAPMEKGLE